MSSLMTQSDYTIITATTYPELEQKVNKYLLSGYKLAGGICTWANGFMQAVYKES